MRAVLVSRYPRVDTPEWKRRVAAGLLDAGIDVAVLYSRATFVDQGRAGLRAEGLGILRRYLDLRRGAGEPATQTLAQWARAGGLPVERVRSLADPEPLRRLRPDLVVLVGADLVPASMLEVPGLGTINPHYGLLPGYRGMNVTEWSVYRGDPIGVTIHLVDPGVDTGPIVLRKEIALEAGETLATLRRRHQALASELLVEAAVQLRDGTARPRPQAIEEGRQYYRMHPALRRVTEARLRAQSPAGQAGARSGSPRSAAAASTSPSATWASHQRR